MNLCISFMAIYTSLILVVHSSPPDMTATALCRKFTSQHFSTTESFSFSTNESFSAAYCYALYKFSNTDNFSKSKIIPETINGNTFCTTCITNEYVPKEFFKDVGRAETTETINAFVQGLLKYKLSYYQLKDIVYTFGARGYNMETMRKICNRVDCTKVKQLEMTAKDWETIQKAKMDFYPCVEFIIRNGKRAVTDATAMSLLSRIDSNICTCIDGFLLFDIHFKCRGCTLKFGNFFESICREGTRWWTDQQIISGFKTIYSEFQKITKFELELISGFLTEGSGLRDVWGTDKYSDWTTKAIINLAENFLTLVNFQMSEALTLSGELIKTGISLEEANRLFAEISKTAGKTEKLNAIKDYITRNTPKV